MSQPTISIVGFMSYGYSPNRFNGFFIWKTVKTVQKMVYDFLPTVKTVG
jgi:hypothetical protein